MPHIVRTASRRSPHLLAGQTGRICAQRRLIIYDASQTSPQPSLKFVIRVAKHIARVNHAESRQVRRVYRHSGRMPRWQSPVLGYRTTNQGARLIKNTIRI
eukprot:scaffold682254_cov74-Prasinocladus_malaysianus.AAC.2